jgi:nitrogen fixation/metabolism regulation signal transduction histidine kinase
MHIMTASNSRTFARKHFFINRKLQGRYMLTFLIPMLVMLVFMLLTLYFASETLIDTTTATIKRDIQTKIALRFQDNLNPSVESYQALLRDISSYVRNFAKDAAYRRVLMISLLWVFGVGVLLVIIQIVLMTIFFSHKLAGPIYRFERVCHELIEGNYDQRIVLRKGDEMQNLAGLFNEAILASRDRLVAMKNAQSRQERDAIAEKLSI